MFKFMKKKVKKPNTINGIKINLDTIDEKYKDLNKSLISFTNILIETSKV